MTAAVIVAVDPSTSEATTARPATTPTRIGRRGERAWRAGNADVLISSAVFAARREGCAAGRIAPTQVGVGRRSGAVRCARDRRVSGGGGGGVGAAGCARDRRVSSGSGGAGAVSMTGSGSVRGIASATRSRRRRGAAGSAPPPAAEGVWSSRARSASRSRRNLAARRDGRGACGSGAVTPPFLPARPCRSSTRSAASGNRHSVRLLLDRHSYFCSH